MQATLKKPQHSPFEIRRSPTSLRWRLVRDLGRPENVVAFDEAVVAFFMESAELLGVPKSVAAIYGVCFASPYSLTYSDIADRLDMSRGSVSQGLRVLCEIGALKLASPPPPEILALSGRSLRRGDHYAPDMELRKVIAHFLEHRLEKQLKSGDTRLNAIKGLLPVNDDEVGTKALNNRLAHLKAWHDRAGALVPVMKAFLKLT